MELLQCHHWSNLISHILLVSEVYLSIVFQLHTSEQVGFTLGTDEFSSQQRQQQQQQYRRAAQPYLPQQQQVGKFSRQQQRQQQLQQQQLQQRQLAEELLERHLTTTTEEVEELVTTSTTRNVLNIESQDLVSLSLAGTLLVWQHYLASALGANDTQHEVDKRLNLAQPCRPSVS